PALYPHPPAQPRSSAGQSLRSGLLLDIDPPRSESRAGSILYLSSRNGRTGKQGRTRLQAQFLRAAGGGEIMKRQIPGLYLNQHGVESKLDGLFLVRVDRARYRWHPQRPFVEFQFSVLEPKAFAAQDRKSTRLNSSH